MLHVLLLEMFKGTSETQCVCVLQDGHYPSVQEEGGRGGGGPSERRGEVRLAGCVEGLQVTPSPLRPYPP